MFTTSAFPLTQFLQEASVCLYEYQHPMTMMSPLFPSNWWPALHPLNSFQLPIPQTRSSQLPWLLWPLLSLFPPHKGKLWLVNLWRPSPRPTWRTNNSATISITPKTTTFHSWTRFLPLMDLLQNMGQSHLLLAFQSRFLPHQLACKSFIYNQLMTHSQSSILQSWCHWCGTAQRIQGFDQQRARDRRWTSSQS